MKFRIHIRRIGLWFVLLLSSVVLNAQLTAKIGEITELSVNEVSGDTYVWELYDTAQDVDFAKTSGNCPESKAIFVGGNNIGSVVNVKWLAEGEYFYKVTAQGAICSNNIKIGRVIVGSANIPPAPVVIVSYDCEKGIATLTASNYEGSLLWNTGEKTESIIVSEEGEYTVIQSKDNQESKATVVTVANMKAGVPVDVNASPPVIPKGGMSHLSAEGCEKGTLRWFTDEELTEKLTETTVYPERTTTYYVLCESAAGCRSKAVPVTVKVATDLECKRMYKNIKIEQLVTPNGDGRNDVWDLRDILKYCKECNKSVQVKLFNRWGAKVYEKEGYMLDDERFDGESKNSLDFINKEKLPSGTYYYIIIVDGEKDKTGFINLITGK